MKKIIFLLIVMMMAQFVFSNCETDFSNLENFYESSKNEDFNSYISLMDTEYIYNYLADKESYEVYVKSAWEVYETKSYSLELLKCNEIPTGSIIFTNVKSEVFTEGKNIELDRDYVTVFENGKIQFVMDYETFIMHQNNAYMALYYNDSKDLIDEELQQAESIVTYLENYEPMKKESSLFWYILILMVIGVMYFYKNKLKFIKKPKNLDASKIKSKLSKAKKNSIITINDAARKIKETTSPGIEKIKNKTKEVYDNREEHIAKAKSIAKKVGDGIGHHSKKAIKTVKKKIDELKK